MVVLLYYFYRIKKYSEIKKQSIIQFNQKIENIELRDSTTNLPNRAYLQKNISKILDKNFTIFLYIDIDHFKSINAAFGHAVGDQVLLEVVERIKSTLGPGMTLVHLGGDEFLVIAKGYERKSINLLVTRILGKIQENYAFLKKINVSASVGVCIYPEHGHLLDTLLINADFAMHKAKALGRNNAYMYSPEDQDAQMQKERSQRLNEIKSALSTQQFLLYYQPKYTPSGHLCGLESLVRWQHPKQGLLTPGHFMDLVEEHGLGIELGYWILEEVCRQISVWQALDRNYFPVSVNLSALQFEHVDLLDTLDLLINKYQIQPYHLMIEVTETTAMRKIDYAIKLFKNLRKKGILIAIDDFGTGYSNFSYLKDLPIDELKIDRSFIVGLEKDVRLQLLLKGMIELMGKLGLITTVEGVETKEQVEFLRALHCPQIQGFYFAKPMPPEHLPIDDKE